MKGLHAWVRRWWAGGAGAAGRAADVAALPAAALYRVGVAARNAAYDRGVSGSHPVPAPVLSVGNLSVGGTGKTPVASWLARELAARGRSPAVVLRGYGDDEVRLHRRWTPDAPVVADPDRVRGALAAVAAGADAVVVDDGFQHRRLRRDFDLVLLAAETPFPGRLLPRGPYREPPSALRRAHGVLVTRRVADGARALRHAEAARAFLGSDAPVGVVRLVPSGWRHLEGGPAETPDGDALAVTGVAAPDAFGALVEAATGRPPEMMAFPDHHPFDDADVDRIVRAAGPRPVLVTEKDAVKLERFAARLPPTRVMELRVEPEAGAGEVLEAALRAVAGGADPGDGP